MIDYNCKKILLVLLKKCYIIIGTALLLGFAAIPLSKLSYQRAESNYSKYNDEIEQKYNAQGIYEIGEINSKIIDIFNACLKDDELMKTVCKQDKWETLYKMLKFQYIDQDNTCRIYISGATDEEQIDILLKAVTVKLPEYLNDFLDENIVFKEISLRIALEENKEFMPVDLMQEPGEAQNNIKVFGSAAILGGVLGAFIVLVFDYIKKSRNYISGRQN